MYTTFDKCQIEIASDCVVAFFRFFVSRLLFLSIDRSLDCIEEMFVSARLPNEAKSGTIESNDEVWTNEYEFETTWCKDVNSLTYNEEICVCTTYTLHKIIYIINFSSSPFISISTRVLSRECDWANISQQQSATAATVTTAEATTTSNFTNSQFDSIGYQCYQCTQTADSSTGGGSVDFDGNPFSGNVSIASLSHVGGIQEVSRSNEHVQCNNHFQCSDV